MQSMTGFGRADSSASGIDLDVSVKSVNGRYLEVRSHLPKKYLSLDNEIQKIAKRHFQRGTVDIYVQRSTQNAVGAGGVRFQAKAATEWVQELRKVLKPLKIDSDVSVRDLLTYVPNFMITDEEAELSSKEKQQLLKTLEHAMASCAKAREKEGQFLKKVGLQCIDDLSKYLKQLTDLRETLVSEASQKMQDRLAKIMGKIELDPQRVVQEVAHLVERSDIEEELQRFGEHVKNVTALFKEASAQGKKLDFYAQELLREINTIGSKSQSAKITEIVVGAKNTIEQLREQIQNIE
jgi:uncharacterized protein (TIGR00255 family)